MSEWQKVPFGSLFLVPTRNGIYKTAEFHGRGTKIVNMGELFANDRIGKQSMERIELSEQEKKVSLLEIGDLLFARRSLVESGAGKAAIVTELPEETTFESSVIRVRLDQEKCNPLFYLYWLRSYNGRSAIMPLVTGVNVKGIRGSELATIIVDYPSIDIQNRITSALSVYDDLIENNQRQIKLLEEAAQRLYKEWFVDLRYPGHENVPVVDGVPNGWKKTVFSERVDVLSGGTPKTSNPEYYNGTIPFYSPKDSDDRFYAFDTETHISESGLENCNSKLYPEGTIIITARGTVGKTTILAKPMAMNQSCYALRSSQVSSVFFLFFALRQEILVLKAMANGGVFDTIIVKTFDRINLTTPSAPVIQAFDKLVTPIMEKMKSLLIENRNLSEARDRLLPKLMSGEITV